MEAAKSMAKKFVSGVCTLVKPTKCPYKILLISNKGSGKTSFLNLLFKCGLIQPLGFEGGFKISMTLTLRML